MGCGTPERSAGGSSYETENAVAARIVRPDGTPASGTLVRARPLVWIVGDSFDSSLDQRTNSDGRIRMNLPSGGWRLEARQGGVVAVIDIPAQGRIPDLGTVHLASPASVMGRAEPGARIGVGGLQQTAVVDAGGYFHFDSLPAGVHVLRQLGSQARAFVQAQAGQTLDAGILRTDSAGQILLDDFEDGDARSRFGAWTGGGWWWVSGTTGVHLSPDGVDTKPARAVFADGGGGNVFHVSADFPANADTSDPFRSTFRASNRCVFVPGESALRQFMSTANPFRCQNPSKHRSSWIRHGGNSNFRFRAFVRLLGRAPHSIPRRAFNICADRLV
jgi:hypothetical protein